MLPPVDPAAVRSPQVAALAEGGAVALVPVGAHEQHGPHLPLATDTLIAEALTRMAADRLPRDVLPWLLPAVPLGKSIEHLGFPGTVSLSTTTILAVCLDIARSAAASGVRAIVFVNGHGGNPEVLQLATRDIRAEVEIPAYTVHAPSLPLPVQLIEQMPRPDLDVHAGFYETSVLLALAPDAVRMADAMPDGLTAADALDRLHRLPLDGPVALPWRSSDLTRSGIIGDPRGANAEWGRQALEAQAGVLATVITSFAGLAWR
jgi:creatinine amidohydrolase